MPEQGRYPDLEIALEKGHKVTIVHEPETGMFEIEVHRRTQGIVTVWGFGRHGETLDEVLSYANRMCANLV